MVLDPGPHRSAAFVRASFSARRGVRLGCRNCSVRPVRAGFSGTCGVRLGGGAGSFCSVRPSGRPARRARCSTRCRETSHFTRAPARRRSRERAARGARGVRLGAGNGGRSTLGAGSRGRSARWRSCGRSFSAREVFDSVSANGSFHLVADLEAAPLGGGPAAGWRQRNCCPARTAGARRTASRRRRPFREQVLQFTPERGRNPARRMRGFDLAFGVDRRVGAASRWSTSSTATQDSPFPQTTRSRSSAVRIRFVDFEQRGRQRAELVDGQSAGSLLRRLVEHVADAGTYPGGRRLLDARLHRDRVGELEPDPADGPREPVGLGHRARLRRARAGNTTISRMASCSAHASVILVPATGPGLIECCRPPRRLTSRRRSRTYPPGRCASRRACRRRSRRRRRSPRRAIPRHRRWRQQPHVDGELRPAASDARPPPSRAAAQTRPASPELSRPATSSSLAVQGLPTGSRAVERGLR